jgi:hypothetical protein
MAIYNALLQNAAMFANPSIALPAFLALITGLSTAQQNLKGTKATGLAALRDTKRDLLWTAMESLRMYVQGIADTMTAVDAISLIKAAGMLVAGVPKRQKALLTAVLTTIPGTVLLVANASLLVGKADVNKKVVFNWQWSSDSGKTWNSVASTPYASTEIPGLTLMTPYIFRVSVTIAKKPGAWSDVVALVVH